MAIDKFKEVVDRRGYLVAQEDRQIFEKEIRKSNFGKGTSDMIEFILYDSNDNQLPQGEDAKMVRYIHIDDSNFSDYFLKPQDNPNTRRTNEAPEFLIDLERLINDAGYSNGIFKTQVTLLNRRIGSEETSNDKMWIHEISPSRTEVRLLPIRNNTTKDLIKRYNLFTEGGNFRDDTIYYAYRFIESLDVQKILEDFLRIKGTVQSGNQYKKLIEKEFGIDFENLLENIKKEFINSMKYFISDRVWDVKKSDYGQPSTSELVELSVRTILRTSETCFLNAVDKFLPARDIQESNELSKDQQVTFDRVKQILKSASSNTSIKATVPDEVSAIVRGCTDRNAMNYNPLAKENDGTCKYSGQIIQAIVVEGCTDKSALNYNKYATKSDGSCKYKSKVVPTPIEVDSELEEIKIELPPIEIAAVTKTFYVWSNTGGIKYQDKSERNLKVTGKEYDKFTISYIKGSLNFSGDVREVPKIKPIPPKVYSYMVENLSNTSNNIKRQRVRVQKEPYFRTGGFQRDELFVNEQIDDLEYRSVIKGSSLSFNYNDILGKTKTSSNLRPGDRILVCAQENTIANLPGLKITKLGNCGEVGLPPKPIIVPPKIFGCTDPKAINYNTLATHDNNSCTYRPIKIVPIRPIEVFTPIEPTIDDVIEEIKEIVPVVNIPTPVVVPTPTPTPTIAIGGGGGSEMIQFDQASPLGLSGLGLEFGNTGRRVRPATFMEDFGRGRFN